MAQSQAVNAPHRLGGLATLRVDWWWMEPALVLTGLLAFFGYLAASIFLDSWAFEIGPYLSPVYEPKLHGEFSVPWFSPAMFIVWGPVGFRATCYYYRMAYYRSMFMSPPACAVGDIQRSYSGESRLPFIIQNVHRFFMYVALVFVPLLWMSDVKPVSKAASWGILTSARGEQSPGRKL